ncbi:hypothetical protein [Spiroplasma endosymbiont of Labia minor]|uniref:hypothetical protein n=1 Tax=Spiroplasma endosymbiont of Labia minor TaxID=3066305 RepID=UPI0030CDCE23
MKKDNVKIVKIIRDNNKTVDSNYLKQYFNPIDNVWYDETTDTLTGNFGETIDDIKIKNGKISLIKNANAHFLSPNPSAVNHTILNNSSLQIDNVKTNNANTLNIIGADTIDSNSNISQLPKEIIKLREEDYVKEQKYKKNLLEKINTSFDQISNLKQSNTDDNYKNKPANFSYDEIANTSTIENVETSNTIENRGYDFPTIDDLSNTDDLNKEIKEKQNLRGLNRTLDFLNNNTKSTTQLVGDLLQNQANYDRLKNDFETSEFNDFESWFKSSKEVKRLQKLALKEQKKMLKMKNK